jgi:serine/threonine protein kinase
LDSPQGREIAGTLDYMPPEARQAGADLDGRVDLYACGVILYEMLTGERPAGTELPSDLNPSVPKLLDEVFRRSYSRLDKRYASADEFLAALAVKPVLPPPLPDRSQFLASATAVQARRDCPQCRQQVEAADQFCMHCGVQLVENVRRCPQCGSYPDPTDRFCIFCGQTLSSPLGATA